ncbi:hypothetical protein K7X08_006634 [Anisodus acutangulus]|uniref:Uncharacterized protein n=1 Tax=Anisodus acutangulus TaxID=402998 RepID=A0A9Q1RP22_9SOLA|nr:hypothetical protein K7X08_006634 [Anisodus acutangulus]
MLKDVGNSGNEPIIAGLSKLQGPILEWFKAQPNPPMAIVYDFFLGWTQDLAQEVGVPRIVFYTSGALLVSILVYIWRNFEAYRGLGLVEFNGLPKSPRFVRDHLPSVFQKFKEGDPTWEIVRNGFIATVGPINLVGGPGRIGNSNVYDGVNERVFTWLDECADGSVLYVAFGSQKLLTKAQMEALTIGLEKSGVRFILVSKQLTAQQEEQGFGSVPEGLGKSLRKRPSNKGLGPTSGDIGPSSHWRVFESLRMEFCIGSDIGGSTNFGLAHGGGPVH